MPAPDVKPMRSVRQHGAHWWRRVTAWALLGLLLAAGVAAAWLMR